MRLSLCLAVGVVPRRRRCGAPSLSATTHELVRRSERGATQQLRPRLPLGRVVACYHHCLPAARRRLRLTLASTTVLHAATSRTPILPHPTVACAGHHQPGAQKPAARCWRLVVGVVVLAATTAAGAAGRRMPSCVGAACSRITACYYSSAAATRPPCPPPRTVPFMLLLLQLAPATPRSRSSGNPQQAAPSSKRNRECAGNILLPAATTCRRCSRCCAAACSCYSVVQPPPALTAAAAATSLQQHERTKRLLHQVADRDLVGLVLSRDDGLGQLVLPVQDEEDDGHRPEVAGG